MKVLWCWRCKMEVPMLDEAEYVEIYKIYGECFNSVKMPNRVNCASLASEENRVADRFKPVCDAYEKITGFKETNHNAIMHHRISLYGEACKNCGKPLRTPRVAFCAACGKTVDSIPAESSVKS